MLFIALHFAASRGLAAASGPTVERDSGGFSGMCQVEAIGVWARNRDEIQFFSTVTLILVTGYYAFVTNRIAEAAKKQAAASNRQAEASEAQLTNAHEALETQREIAQRAETHAERVLIESTKARLSALTPPCTVWHEPPDRMLQQDQTSLGNVSMSTYDEQPVRLAIQFVIRNDGESTTLATAEPCSIEDEHHVLDFGWTATTAGEAVAPHGGSIRLEFLIVAPGRFFRTAGRDTKEIEFKFSTRSPHSEVTDRYVWVGLPASS